MTVDTSTLQVRTTEQLLEDFAGANPEQMKMLNLIWTIMQAIGPDDLVVSVNGKTGVVTLEASDVGAAPAGTGTGGAIKPADIEGATAIGQALLIADDKAEARSAISAAPAGSGNFGVITVADITDAGAVGKNVMLSATASEALNNIGAVGLTDTPTLGNRAGVLASAAIADLASDAPVETVTAKVNAILAGLRTSGLLLS